MGEEEEIIDLPPLPSTSKAFIYETPETTFKADVHDDDDDDEFVEKDAVTFGREKVGPVASAYLVPYLYNKSYLDTVYGIRKDGDAFMIGDSPVHVDEEGDVTVRGKEFKGTTGLWELLTRKRVNREKITTDDLKKYKKILLLTNAHLSDYQPGGDIRITRGRKYNDVIAPLFPQTRRRGIESALRRRWVKY